MTKAKIFILGLALVIVRVHAQDVASIEAALNRLDKENRNWVQNSCPKSLGPSLWLSCVDREMSAFQTRTVSQETLSSELIAWVEKSCPRSLGPSLNKSCIERETATIKSGIPSLGRLPKNERDWIAQSCQRSLGPSLYKYCVLRESKALGANLD